MKVSCEQSINYMYFYFNVESILKWHIFISGIIGYIPYLAYMSCYHLADGIGCHPSEPTVKQNNCVGGCCIL